MGRWIRTLSILAAGIGLGSLRDYLFINLNYQLDHLQRSTPYSFAHSRFQAAVQGLGQQDLLRLKWLMAVLAILAMWALCQLLLRVHGAPPVARRGVTGLFIAIPVVALVLHLLARWIPLLEEASVNLLHAVQYPVLLLVVLVALLLFPRRPSGGT